MLYLRSNGIIKAVKILLDTGTLIHSNTVDAIEFDQEINWGGGKHLIPVGGYIKAVRPYNWSKEQDYEAELLFAIGDLIRAGQVLAHTYQELQFERFRGRQTEPMLNSFKYCKISSCDSPLERSKFRSTVNFIEHISKGGKKDRCKGYNGCTQIAFFEWLVNLKSEDVKEIIKHSEQLELTSFERASLEDLSEFQKLCKKGRGKENLPDYFHVWTAQRSEMDYFLTLDKKLVSKIRSLSEEKNEPLIFSCKVVTPSLFLKDVGILEPTMPAVEPDKVYLFHEMQRLERFQYK